ncbi:hypothetical protein AVEN_31708-1 [Araneus ventricosus]|uniref:Reverse transcriptase domain-containing protein n=1 Tax=Araneus ventricosus TaxID=182803 RepID=A0A4Y2LFF5_ARAVE|nr:hypothetical protein AVEN_31708-1 [Araneus ventricosus]
MVCLQVQYLQRMLSISNSLSILFLAFLSILSNTHKDFLVISKLLSTCFPACYISPRTRSKEKHAVLISLDISRAFDSLQLSSIRDRFASLSLFSDTNETLLDTLRNRKVAIQTSEGRSSGNRLRDVHRVHVAGQHFGTSWQTKSYRYSGLKEFIYKHLPMILRSSSQTTPEKGSSTGQV